jgi:hypothetical protein
MRGLAPLSSPAWYRGFDPIAVPWGEGDDSMRLGLPDILSFARQPQSPQGAGQGPGSGQGTGGGTSSGSAGGSASGGATSGSQTGGASGPPTGGGTLPPVWQPGGSLPLPRSSTGDIDWGVIGGVLGWPAAGDSPTDPTSDFPVREGAPAAPYPGTPAGTFGVEGDPESWGDAEWQEWQRRRGEWQRWWEANRVGAADGGGLGGSSGGSTGSAGGGSGGGGGNGQPTTPPPPLPPTDWGFGIDIPDAAFDPDVDAIVKGIGALPDIIGGSTGNIPQFMPGEVGGAPAGGSAAGNFGNFIARLKAIPDILDFKEDPRGAFTGAITLANPAAGALAGGFLALSDWVNAGNSGARQDRRDELNERGRMIADPVMGAFWRELGRDPEWVLNARSGVGSEDAQFYGDWAGWLGSSGVGGRPDTPFQNFGGMAPQDAYRAIGQSLVDYYGTLSPEAQQSLRGLGSGEYAPRAFLQNNFGWDPEQPAPNLGGWGANAGDLSGLEYLFNEISPRMMGTQNALLTQPDEWTDWLAGFQGLRPNVAIPQPTTTLDAIRNWEAWRAQAEQNFINLGNGYP